MKHMSLEEHAAMTEKHLDAIAADAEAQAEADGVEKYRKQMEESDPTPEDFDRGTLSDVERKFIHEQTVHNILRTIEEDEDRKEKMISWQRKKEMLRAVLLELDRSLAIDATDEELSLREKIVGRLVDMERFMTERHLTDAVNELLDSPGAYQDAMKEAWAATLENPEAMKAVNGDWLRLYGQAERALIDAMKQEKLKPMSIDTERKWLRFVLQKLDAAEAIMPDEIAHV
ncbi:MAG: hypothetical protein KBD19_01335 [Candidatus Moranbacteria bacterium]|nr:hypothetical protein [Candidatus Moranbacteria bacterium]